MSDTQDEEFPVGDMYSLGNHEQDLLIQEDDDDDDVQSTGDSSKSNRSDTNQKELDHISDENRPSVRSESSGPDESARLLQPDAVDKNNNLNTKRLRKPSLSRKLLAFGVDHAANDDILGDFRDDPFSTGDGHFIDVSMVPKTAPLKWLSHRGNDFEYEAIREMVLKTETVAKRIKDEENKGRGEEDGYRTIAELDHCLCVATEKYTKARAATLKLTSDMKDTMQQVDGKIGHNWDFFREITQKWIKCLTGTSSYINEFDECESKMTIEDDQQYLQSQLPKHLFANATTVPVRRVSRVKKPRMNSRINPAPNPRFNIVAENIRKSRKTIPRSCMRLPKLTDEENRQLDELLELCKSEASALNNVAKCDHTTNHYSLKTNEKQRLDDVNVSLRNSRSADTTNFEPISDEPVGKITSTVLEGNSEKLPDPCTNKSELTVMRMQEQSAEPDDVYKRFKATRVVHFALGIDDK